jgi:hypothetical protein
MMLAQDRLIVSSHLMLLLHWSYLGKPTDHFAVLYLPPLLMLDNHT